MYDVTTDDLSGPQIRSLPAEALPHVAELYAVLETAPWNGAPNHRSMPDGLMRSLPFGPTGRGIAIYLILEELRRVDLLTVTWVE